MSPPPCASSVLSPLQVTILSALTDRLIPPDADTPGGAVGGAFAYIVRELEDGGNLVPFRAAYRSLLDTLAAQDFAARDASDQDTLLHRLEREGTVSAALRIAAEHAQEGYYTTPAIWPSVGYLVTG